MAINYFINLIFHYDHLQSVFVKAATTILNNTIGIIIPLISYNLSAIRPETDHYVRPCPYGVNI